MPVKSPKNQNLTLKTNLPAKKRCKTLPNGKKINWKSMHNAYSKHSHETEIQPDKIIFKLINPNKNSFFKKMFKLIYTIILGISVEIIILFLTKHFLLPEFIPIISFVVIAVIIREYNRKPYANTLLNNSYFDKYSAYFYRSQNSVIPAHFRKESNLLPRNSLTTHLKIDQLVENENEKEEETSISKSDLKRYKREPVCAIQIIKRKTRKKSYELNIVMNYNKRFNIANYRDKNLLLQDAKQLKEVLQVPIIEKNVTIKS